MGKTAFRGSGWKLQSAVCDLLGSAAHLYHSVVKKDPGTWQHVQVRIGDRGSTVVKP
jgi:hypothetical protein